MPVVVGAVFGDGQLTIVMSMLISSWTFGYFMGAPIAGYLLEAYGGAEGGAGAYRPAFFYAGSLTLASAGLILAVLLMMNRKIFARWGDSTFAEGPDSRQKILIIREIPFLVIVDVLDHWPPVPTSGAKPEPLEALRGCDALLLAFREDVPQTYRFLEDFYRAMDSNRASRHAFRSIMTAVLGLQGPGPDGPGDDRGARLARSIGAGNLYRLSGIGSAVGLDAILEDFVVPLFEQHYGPPPGRVAGHNPWKQEGTASDNVSRERVIAIVIIYNIFGLVSTATASMPVEAFWEPEVKGHRNPESYMWVVIGFHVVTNFLIFLLPMPAAYRMTLPRGQKLSVTLALALGFMLRRFRS
ncbi:uncharacterized protein DNG_10221 [Cephalotrichum gorgonifer]|uniref:Rhodopsin domain-containing protein n=1 Tax=Cephalotrichum gorgonifer TaxID=2041049 RepID=A0AAE8N946_9PEZI|nr:uncharacterized protein DNG_10221 [Cephalotrichum gorgonifer]